MAYPSQRNFEAVAAVGATPYFAFKSNATGDSGGLYEKADHYFALNREEWFRLWLSRPTGIRIVMTVATAAIGMALFFRWVYVASAGSNSRILRVLETLRSYVADEPASFEHKGD